MEVQGKVALVTGGASGIGEAISRRFVAAGAQAVIVADRDLARAEQVAASLGKSAFAIQCDVSRESDIVRAVEAATQRHGRIDICMSNAGILGPAGGLDINDTVWEDMWKIHVMAHVWAARALVPAMVERGEGYFCITASAAGLLNIVETAPYGVTKHAAVGFAEWLRIAYGRRGIRVSCLCPQSVRTPMTAAGAGSAGVNGELSPEQVAESVMATMAQETFLCLPHPEVEGYMKAKTADYDRWLGGMQKLYANHMAAR